MKELIEFAFVIRTRELSGKGAKALGTAAKAVTKKYEPQITRIVDAVTQAVVKELEPKEESKNES